MLAERDRANIVAKYTVVSARRRDNKIARTKLSLSAKHKTKDVDVLPIRLRRIYFLLIRLKDGCWLRNIYFKNYREMEKKRSYINIALCLRQSRCRAMCTPAQGAWSVLRSKGLTSHAPAHGFRAS
jgi:hypothetical protein